MGSPLLKDLRLRRTLARNLNRLPAEHRLSQNPLAHYSDVHPKQRKHLCRQRTGCGIDARWHVAGPLEVEAWELLVPEKSGTGEGISDG